MRMGRDKSLIDYQGKPQRYYLYELLQTVCEEVFISCNAGQSLNIIEGYKKIVDEEVYNDIGPMAALLSATKSHAQASFIVIGCDYPFLDSDAIDKLVEERDADKDASCFYNSENDMIEPLLCTYEPSIYAALNTAFGEQRYSLRKLLEQSRIKKIFLDKMEWIKSIDTQEEYDRFMV